MALQLPSSVSSPQDLLSLKQEVKAYARWYSQASIKKKVTSGPTAEPPLLSPGATELLRAWAAQKTLSGQLLEDLITALDDFSETAPSMTITLAAPPPGDLKQTIVAWCRKNLSPGVLVTFKFNATILGGMVVHYGSHIFDWSFRRQILASRNKFPETLRRV